MDARKAIAGRGGTVSPAERHTKPPRGDPLGGGWAGDYLVGLCLRIPRFDAERIATHLPQWVQVPPLPLIRP